ncbi:hypothetical protein D3C87_1405550 [compost metagenome]
MRQYQAFEGIYAHRWRHQAERSKAQTGTGEPINDKAMDDGARRMAYQVQAEFADFVRAQEGLVQDLQPAARIAAQGVGVLLHLTPQQCSRRSKRTLQAFVQELFGEVTGVRNKSSGAAWYLHEGIDNEVEHGLHGTGFPHQENRKNFCFVEQRHPLFCRVGRGFFVIEAAMGVDRDIDGVI